MFTPVILQTHPTMNMKTEKQNIERYTAIGFLEHYNQLFLSDFNIVEVTDAPDIRCKDSKGNELNIEITITEDSNGDMKSVFGRSDNKSIEQLKEHLQRVKEGKERIKINCLSSSIRGSLIRRIEAKLFKDYGRNVALVVRDSSGVDWDWDFEIPNIAVALKGKRNPYDKGIWLLNRTKTRIFRIV